MVESFKATLEEAVLADFLIHVIDGSSENVEEHYKTTLDVLKELGADEKRIISAINKTDLISTERLEELKNIFPEAVLISVQKWTWN